MQRPMHPLKQSKNSSSMDVACLQTSPNKIKTTGQHSDFISPSMPVLLTETKKYAIHIIMIVVRILCHHHHHHHHHHQD